MMPKKINIKEGFMAILYNATYGGWSPSKQVVELYNTRMSQNPPSAPRSEDLVVGGFPPPDQIDPSFVPIGDAFDILCLERHDPLLIEIYQELGDAFDESKVSKTKVAIISDKYKDFYVIREYDGFESVAIDKTRYDLHQLTETYHKIKEILSSDNTADNEDKIRQLKQICEIN